MKRQTLILVVIGVILFVAGSAIAFASVKGASKKTGSSVNVAPVTTSVVVAKANIPAGTTGQSIISNNLAAIQTISTKSYTATDLGSLQGLSSEVLTAAVKKGQALSATELTASSSAISVPMREAAWRPCSWNQSGAQSDSQRMSGLAGSHRSSP